MLLDAPIAANEKLLEGRDVACWPIASLGGMSLHVGSQGQT